MRRVYLVGRMSDIKLFIPRPTDPKFASGLYGDPTAWWSEIWNLIEQADELGGAHRFQDMEPSSHLTTIYMAFQRMELESRPLCAGRH